MKLLNLQIIVEDSKAAQLITDPGLISYTEEPVRIRAQRYILLPGEFCTPQNYEGKHPDLAVADSRLSFSLEVLKVAKELNLQVRNNNQGFIGYLTFDQTEQLYDNLQKITGLFFLSPWYAGRFLNNLQNGMQKEREVKYEDGESVSIDDLTKIYNDWAEQRDLWRATWLNVRFKRKDKGLTITHPVVQKNGEIKRVTEPLDKDTLMEDRIPGIDLSDWLKDPTAQGLVKSTNRQGRVYSWSPMPDYVPSFGANSGWVFFGCIGDPWGSESTLGSWPARVFHRK